MGDEQHLGVEGPTCGSLLAEQVVRDRPREQLESALRVSIRQAEQDPGCRPHEERHQLSDRRGSGRSLRLVVTPADVDSTSVGRPPDAVQLIDPELVVGVEHHQVLGIRPIRDVEHRRADRQRLAAMREGQDLDLRPLALRGACRDLDRVVGGPVIGDEYGAYGIGVRGPVTGDRRDGLFDPARFVERRHDDGDRRPVGADGHVDPRHLATMPFVADATMLDVVLTTLPSRSAARCHGIVHSPDDGATVDDRARRRATGLPDETLVARPHQYTSVH